MKTENKTIPVIDLFAGPGGLCEGFSSVVDAMGARRFDVKVSVEKDPIGNSPTSTVIAPPFVARQHPI